MTVSPPTADLTFRPGRTITAYDPKASSQTWLTPRTVPMPRIWVVEDVHAALCKIERAHRRRIRVHTAARATALGAVAGGLAVFWAATR